MSSLAQLDGNGHGEGNFSTARQDKAWLEQARCDNLQRIWMNLIASSGHKSCMSTREQGRSWQAMQSSNVIM
jgi:hypothetical protein